MEQVELSDQWWQEIYDKGDIFWHLPAPHESLTTYFDERHTTGSPKVLIPLIGNTVDAKWLSDQGCEVIGVDMCDAPVKLLFSQHNMGYSHGKTAFPEFSVYQNEDHKIKVFLGNFYQFNKEVAGTQFDLIWDRAAFTAINVSDREKYVEVLRNVLAPDGIILLSGFNYDIEKYQGPPHYVLPEHMDQLFGRDFSVELLSKREVLQQWHKKDWKIDWLEESVYLLKRTDNSAQPSSMP